MPYGPIQVGVSAVHEDELTRGVRGTKGCKKNDGVSDFLRSGQSLLQRNQLPNVFLYSIRICLRLKKSLILICQALRRQNAIDANALSGAKATAHFRVSALIAPFAAAYPEVWPCPVTATFEPRLTMQPGPVRRYGNAWWVIA